MSEHEERPGFEETAMLLKPGPPAQTLGSVRPAALSADKKPNPHNSRLCSETTRF